MLALDLSLSCTGFASFVDGKLKASGSFKPPSKLSNNRKIQWLCTEIKKQIGTSTKEIVIEDTFLGLNAKSFKDLNRLAGAVIYVSLLSGYDPVFYEAVSVRSILDIDTRINKFDSQVLVMKLYYSKINLKLYEEKALEIRKNYVTKKLTLKQYNSRLTQVSDLIGRETGVTNDETDAILLGLAHIKESKNGKSN